MNFKSMHIRQLLKKRCRVSVLPTLIGLTHQKLLILPLTTKKCNIPWVKLAFGYNQQNVAIEILRVGNTDIVPKFLLCCFFVRTLLLLNKSNPFWAVLLCSNFFQIICTLSSLEFPSKNWTCSIFFHSSQNSYDRCYGSFRLQPSLIGFLLSTYRGSKKN